MKRWPSEAFSTKPTDGKHAVTIRKGRYFLTTGQKRFNTTGYTAAIATSAWAARSINCEAVS